MIMNTELNKYPCLKNIAEEYDIKAAKVIPKRPKIPKLYVCIFKKFLTKRPYPINENSIMKKNTYIIIIKTF